MSWHEIINTILFNIKSILKLTIISTFFLLLILLFIYPRSYKAVVTVLPPEKSAQFNSLTSLLDNNDFSNLLSAGTSNPNSQLFIEILKSRSAADYVVRKLNLKSKFKTKDELEAVKLLQENLNTELTKEGIIKLDVIVNSSIFPLFTDNGKLKNLSALISNSYIEALDHINRKKISSKAKNARIYIEHQLVETKNQLDSVEIKLMDFQKINKTISLPDQLKASIDEAANLRSQIAKIEIETELLGKSLTPDNKSIISLNEKLNSLKNQYKKIEIGSDDYLLSFNNIPGLGKELSGLLREVKIQNQVYLFLQQEYYKEKIQENRDNPTVEVLDEAIIPKEAFAPRPIFVTAIGGIFFFLILSVITILKKQKIKLF